VAGAGSGEGATGITAGEVTWRRVWEVLRFLDLGDVLSDRLVIVLQCGRQSYSSLSRGLNAGCAI
jgi:hypothetical protein